MTSISAAAAAAKASAAFAQKKELAAAPPAHQQQHRASASASRRRARAGRVRAVTTPAQAPRAPASTGSVKSAMTMTEKILARASERASLEPGENVWVDVDVLMTHDVCLCV